MLLNERSDRGQSPQKTWQGRNRFASTLSVVWSSKRPEALKELKDDLLFMIAVCVRGVRMTETDAVDSFAAHSYVSHPDAV